MSRRLDAALDALGFVTEDTARLAGFTHDARFHGIPCWWDERDNSLMAKWLLLDLLIVPLARLEALALEAAGVEPSFAIRMGRRL